MAEGGRKPAGSKSKMNPYAIAPLISSVLLLGGGIYIVKKGTGRVFNWLFAFAVFALSAIELGNFKLSAGV